MARKDLTDRSGTMSATLDRTIEFPTLNVGGRKGKVDVPEGLTVLRPEEQPAQGVHCFRVLTVVDGDKRISWDSSSLKEIKTAEGLFNDLVKEGLVPYRVGTDGKASAKKLDAFDPFAEEVIFVPSKVVVGG